MRCFQFFIAVRDRLIFLQKHRVPGFSNQGYSSRNYLFFAFFGFFGLLYFQRAWGIWLHSWLRGWLGTYSGVTAKPRGRLDRNENLH